MVVGRHAVNPRQAIPDKVRPINRLLYIGGMLVDAIEAANKGIMAQSHMRGFDGERVILGVDQKYFANSRPSKVPLQHSLTLPVSNFGVGINHKGLSTYIGVFLDILTGIDSFFDLEEYGSFFVEDSMSGGRHRNEGAGNKSCNCLAKC